MAIKWWHHKIISGWLKLRKLRICGTNVKIRRQKMWSVSTFSLTETLAQLRILDSFKTGEKTQQHPQTSDKQFDRWLVSNILTPDEMRERHLIWQEEKMRETLHKRRWDNKRITPSVRFQQLLNILQLKKWSKTEKVTTVTCRCALKERYMLILV